MKRKWDILMADTMKYSTTVGLSVCVHLKILKACVHRSIDCLCILVALYFKRWGVRSSFALS